MPATKYKRPREKSTVSTNQPTAGWAYQTYLGFALLQLLHLLWVTLDGLYTLSSLL